jgi:hypothetical protein
MFAQLHREFDQDLERYEIWNQGRYDKSKHLAHVQAIVDTGRRLIKELSTP